MKPPEAGQSAAARDPGPDPHQRSWMIAVAIALVLIPLLIVFVDPAVARWALTIEQTTPVLRLLDITEPLGEPLFHVGLGVVTLLIAAVAHSRRAARLGALVLLSFAAIGSGSYLVKMAVRRPRPWADVAWSSTFTDWSWAFDGRAHAFPSGDVSVVAGLAMLGYLAVGRGRARYLFFAIPLLSAIGRVLGAKHHPADCLAALLLGMGLVALLYRIWPERRAPKPHAC